MNRSRFRIKDLAILSFIIFSSGCIVPNKDLIQLRSDVDDLKTANARLIQTAGLKDSNGKSRIDNIERELALAKTELGKEISFLSRESNKNNASSQANLDSIKSDFQLLSGRFEEVRHLSDKTLNSNKAFLEITEGRLSAIETRLSKLEEDIAAQSAILSGLKGQDLNLREGSEKRAEPTAKDLYKSALDLILSGKTEKSRNLFKQYLRDYPKGALANNAQFWIGESYYNEKEYEKAIVEYDDVLKKYPAGGKVPAALLKQGMAFRKMKDYKTGNAILNKLIKEYPASEEAQTAKKLTARKKKK
ncbi:MAG: tol-pal system protein YbgF [bacterium]|nr:tol-pal system protein YbgF [bacterium]